MNFTGDFELLPIRSEIVFGTLPQFPTAADYHAAVSDLEHNQDDPAAHWRVEAIRERRMRPGVTLDEATLREINRRVAARLYARCREG